MDLVLNWTRTAIGYRVTRDHVLTFVLVVRAVICRPNSTENRILGSGQDSLAEDMHQWHFPVNT
jgi:hypothetical protein